MERFKVDTKDDALLEDLNDELEGMMLEDTDNSNQYTGAPGYTRVGDASSLLQMENNTQGALEKDEALENDELEGPQHEPVKYYNDDIKQKL